jgi:methenyltetrahydromethanopterin cyclohydrolase
MVQEPTEPTQGTEGSGIGRVRLSVTYGGHAHLYIYREGEELDVVDVIARHVAEGRLEPDAGDLLCMMLWGGFDDA